MGGWEPVCFTTMAMMKTPEFGKLCSSPEAILKNREAALLLSLYRLYRCPCTLGNWFCLGDGWMHSGANEKYWKKRDGRNVLIYSKWGGGGGKYLFLQLWPCWKDVKYDAFSPPEALLNFREDILFLSRHKCPCTLRLSYQWFRKE